MRRTVLSILAANHYGVLTRVSSLFGRRCFNIREISVGETESPGFSRMTIAVEEDEAQVIQICLQLQKLEDVRRVDILPEGELIERELVLIKARCPDGQGAALEAEAVRAGGVLLDRREGCSIFAHLIRHTDGQALRAAYAPWEVLEICRAGSAAMNAGAHTLYQYSGKQGTADGAGK